MAFDRESRPARPMRGKRRKVCQFCAEKCEHIDYKDAAKLRRFIRSEEHTSELQSPS